MTTKLTYWDRSPQESTQSAGDCTSGQIPEGIPFVNKETPCGILLHKGTCSSP